MLEDDYFSSALLSSLHPLQSDHAQSSTATILRGWLFTAARGAPSERPQPVPDVSTVRRWFCSLDSAERLVRLRQLHLDLPSAPTTKGSTDPSRPGTSFPFLRKMMSAVVDCLARGGVFAYDPCGLSWRTLAHFLHVLLPLRS